MIAAAVTTAAGCLDEAEPDGGYDVSLAESSLAFTGAWVYDAGTLCSVSGVTMHCCPNGYAMVGAHINNNVFKCAQLSGVAGARFLDLGTLRNGMHACPYGTVMVGLHANSNYLACQAPASPVVSEYVDGVPPTNDGYPMHVCRSGGVNGGYAMSGIHISTNRFTCAR